MTLRPESGRSRTTAEPNRKLDAIRTTGSSGGRSLRYNSNSWILLAGRASRGRPEPAPGGVAFVHACSRVGERTRLEEPGLARAGSGMGSGREGQPTGQPRSPNRGADQGAYEPEAHRQGGAHAGPATAAARPPEATSPPPVKPVASPPRGPGRQGRTYQGRTCQGRNLPRSRSNLPRPNPRRLPPPLGRRRCRDVPRPAPRPREPAVRSQPTRRIAAAAMAANRLRPTPRESPGRRVLKPPPNHKPPVPRRRPRSTPAAARSNH